MATDVGYQYDLFVSHADADRDWVEGYLLDTLHEAGVKYYSEEAFALGAPRLTEFERAIQQSARTLLVLSPAYMGDNFAQFTDLLAGTYGLETARWPVVPLVLRPVELPAHLAGLKGLDATDPDHWAEVMVRLCRDLHRPVPEVAPKPPCPYPGMVPFREEHARAFFGRDAEIRQMLQHLRNNPFLLVVGPSGSGKSSLVFAGLLPRLHASSYWPRGTWLTRTMRPAGRPLEALAEALGGDPDILGPTLAALLAAHAPAARLLLVIDQFEELFSLTERADQARFIACLKALRAHPQCSLILTMRADFYHDLMNSDLWPLAPSERMEVAVLRSEALRQAIRQPAADVGVYLEAGLLERLLDDASDEPGVLPLLQETMVLLWESMQRRLLPLAAYEQLGSGERSGLAVALSRKADATLAALSPDQQRIARRIFVRLVQFGEGRADTRRQQCVADLSSVTDDQPTFDVTLRYLIDNRLLTVTGEEDDDGRKIDIAHEAIISGWPILSQWLVERREAEQIRRLLEGKVAEWVRLRRGHGGLLDRAEVLEAERWLASPDALELGYNPMLEDLVETSRAAIAAQDAREEAVRQREVAQAQALAAEAEARSREARTAARLLRRRFWIALTLTGLSIFLGVLSFRNARIAADSQEVAEHHLLVANAQTLAAQSVAQLNHDPELSVLIALEAISTTRTLNQPVVSQAADALHEALLSLHTLLTLRGHEGIVYSAAWSADGRRLATAGEDGTVRVWDAATGALLLTLRGHEGMVRSVGWSPDGGSLVTGGDDKTVRIWDAVSGQQFLTLHGHLDIVYAVAWSPDSLEILSASHDGTARIWDAETGRERLTLKGHKGKLWGASWSPDGSRVATAADDNARIWDAVHGEELLILHGHGEGGVNTVAWSPDGHRVVTASSDKTARIWDARLGRESLVLYHEDQVWGVAWSPDGRTIATVGKDQTARIWNARTGQTLSVLRGHTSGVRRTAWSPDSTRLLTASSDGTARVWDVAPARERPQLVGEGGPLHMAVYSPDGQRIAAAYDDHAVRLWDAQSGRLHLTLRGHQKTVWAVAWSPDGRRLASAGEDNATIIWDASTGQILANLRGHSGQVWSVAWSPDGIAILTVSDDKKAIIWDARTFQSRYTLIGHQDAVYGAAWSPDSTRVVTAGADKTAIVWDAATGKRLLTLVGHRAGINSVAYHPDGAEIATGGQDKSIIIWDAHTGKLLHTLTGHAGWVNTVSFSPDGTQLLSAGRDETARIWEDANGQADLTIQEETGELTGASFSPDGHNILTTAQDGIARQYLARIADVMTLAEARLTRRLTLEERASYLMDLQNLGDSSK